MRAILAAALLALAGCQLDDATIGGTIVAVAEAERGEDLLVEPSPKYYDDPLVPEVAWHVEVRLDDGSEVSVTHQGERRYAPGERVRVIFDDDAALLL